MRIMRKQIAVAHPNLMEKGGAEAVAMHIIESIQDKHDVTIISLISPDIGELNDWFDTDVSTDVSLISPSPLIQRFFQRIDRCHLLKTSFLSNFTQSHIDSYDLIVSSYNEMSISTNSVQYLDAPQYQRWRDHESTLWLKPYNAVCSLIESYSPDTIMSNTIIANSRWTANRVSQTYREPDYIVYPPINTNNIYQSPWQDRENGFLCIGRVSPAKKQLRCIKILNNIRNNGHDVHLHIAGPVGDQEYAEKVKSRAKKYDYIHFDGELSRSEILEMIATHRFGIHGKSNEHFGIVIAEMVAGGIVPFIPDGGGQTEIVGPNPNLVYSDPDDAVQKIDRVLSNPEIQRAILDSMKDREEEFGVNRFKEKINKIICQELNTCNE